MNNIFTKIFCPDEEFIFDFEEDVFTFGDKKLNVKFNNSVKVILIPNISEYEIIGKNKLWYSIDNLEKMKNEFLNELDVLSCLKSVSRYEALKIWKSINS